MKIFLLFVITIQCHSFTLKTAIENLQSQKWDFSNARRDLNMLFQSECDEIVMENSCGTEEV